MSQSVMWKFLTAADLRAKAQLRHRVLPWRPWSSTAASAVGVDTILSETCARRLLSIVADTPVVAPTLWCRMAEHHMAFGGTFTFTSRLPAVLLCLLKSVERHGFTAF